MNPDMPSATTSYWCYRCNRFVRLLRAQAQDHMACPHCGSGFIEEIHTNASSDPFPSAAMPMFVHEPQNSFNLRRQGFRRRRRNAGARSPFNPVIVLRGPGDGGTADDGGAHSFELYYDDGDGSGLRPLPPSMSEFLLGSGFDRLLEQFSQIDANGLGRPENPPASKTAIESMPTVEIVEDYVSTDAHCAICKEAFKLGSEAREMPCKHIYHSDCIVPWLSMRNSCPVCRSALPSDPSSLGSGVSGQIDDETVGLTIWRLPGGGFAVGRFPGGRDAAEGNLPVVYTEMDGGLNANGAQRRTSRDTRSIRVSESRGLGRIFRNFFSFFGRLGSRSTSSSSSYSGSELGSMSGSLRQLSRVFSRNSRRRNRNWVFED